MSLKSSRRLPLRRGQVASDKAMNCLRIQLEGLVKTEIANAIRQVEGFLAIEHYFETGLMTPEFHGWPISPDLGRYLIHLLETNAYDFVIEFGSGTSSWLIARVKQTQKKKKSSQPVFKHLVIEHEPYFLNKTRDLLAQSGLESLVDLECCPLLQIHLDSDQYSYYDCQVLFAGLSNQFNDPNKKILVLVDGPPASIGLHARYPALETLLHAFPNARMDVILDDYIRLDEQEIAQKWLDDLERERISHSFEVLRLEKQAFILKINQGSIN